MQEVQKSALMDDLIEMEKRLKSEQKLDKK